MAAIVFLDMMLVDTDRQRPAFFSHVEHFPVSGEDTA
mgnify:CR=1 FL=1